MFTTRTLSFNCPATPYDGRRHLTPVLVRFLYIHGTYSLYIKGNYYNDLESIVQLTQPWTSANGKFKNLVVVQSHGACLTWSSV